MVLKEKVLVEEENFQEYKRRRKEEKLSNWREKVLHGEFNLLSKLQMWLKRSPGDGSRMVF